METLKVIANLEIGFFASNFDQPKIIAQSAKSSCPILKRIADQEYPRCCDIFRGNQIRNSLINYARLKLKELKNG